MAAVLQVFIFKDGEFIGTEIFSEREIIVGRDPEVADLVLESEQISREHARLEHDGTRVVVIDNGSTNGVLINDTLVQQAEVGRLDEIFLGNFSIKAKLVRQGKAAKKPAADATQVMPSRQEGAAKAAAAPMPRLAAPALSPAAIAAARHEATVTEPAAFAGEDTRMESSVLATPPSAVPPGPPELRRPVPAKSTAARSGVGLGERLAGIFKTKRAAPAPQTEGILHDPLADTAQAEPLLLAANPDLDDDDDNEPFTAVFCLKEHLCGEDRELAAELEEGAWGVEVISFRGDGVDDVQLLGHGKFIGGRSFYVGPKLGVLRRLKARDLPSRIRLLKVKRGGSCELRFRKGSAGTLVRAGQSQHVSSIPGTANHRLGTISIALQKGDVVDVADGGFTYHIRYVRPPRYKETQVPWKQRLKPSKLDQKAFGGSLIGHLIGVALVSLLMPTQVLDSRLPGEEFIEVTLDTPLELEAPPEPEPQPTPQPEPQAQPAPAQPVPKKQQATPTKKPKKGGTTAAPAGVLGMLNKTGAATAPGPASAVAAVSNLSASKVPGGSSGFKVSGLAAKTPTSDMSLGGGGGGLNTKGASELLRGGGGGAGKLAGGQGSKKVGGIVQKNPKAMRAAGQGSLDRDAILRVINQNIARINRCYERELTKSPELSGKVEVEWTIATNGTVKATRQKFSSLNSSAAVTCILNEVKTWRFPSPKGGEVVVSNPFIFKSISF